jgi:hypothetical protein
LPRTSSDVLQKAAVLLEREREGERGLRSKVKVKSTVGASG